MFIEWRILVCKFVPNILEPYHHITSFGFFIIGIVPRIVFFTLDNNNFMLSRGFFDYHNFGLWFGLLDMGNAGSTHQEKYGTY